MQTIDLINRFLRNREARNLRQASLDWYRRALMRFAEAYPKLPTKPEPIEDFLAALEGSDETRHAHYWALNALYRFGHQRCRVKNPMEKLEAPRRANKVMPTCGAGELMALLQAARSARDYALLALLIDSGIRASEAAGLRREDIRGEVIVVDGKTGQREVAISEETSILLLSLPDKRNSYIFTSPTGQPLTRSGIYRIVRRCMAEAGIPGPKLGPHRLRHSFGKGYLVNGGDIRSLQMLMGHRYISTTEKYASLTSQDTIDKHHQFTPLKSAHAAAQQSLFDPIKAVREAEEIITSGKGSRN